MSWEAAWDMLAAPSDYQAPTTRVFQLPAEGTGHVHPATQPIPIPRRANVEQEDVHAGSYGPDSWSKQDCALSYNAATANSGDPSISSFIAASGAQRMTPETVGRPGQAWYRLRDLGFFVGTTPIPGRIRRGRGHWRDFFRDFSRAAPTAAAYAPTSDPHPVASTSNSGCPALYAQQTYEDVYNTPLCISTATTGRSPLHPGFATSLADYNHAATPPCMHPPSNDQEYALEAHESLRLALIARPAPGPLVPSGITKRKTRDSSEDRVLEWRSRKRVVSDIYRGDSYPSLENDAMAQWARMPENLRRKWSEAMAAQQLGSADGATTRRSRSPDKDSSPSSAYESRAPALGQDTHAISRAPPTAPMRRRGRGAHTTSSGAQSRSGSVQHRASCASKSTSQGRHSFAQSGPSTSSTPDPNPKAPLVKPTHKNGVRKPPQKVVQRPAGAKVDAYKKCPWKGCEYAYDFDLHGRSDWAQAVKNHLEDTHALEADLEADEKYFTLEGICEKEKRKGIVSCKMVVDGLPPCTWKGARARFYNHILREEYGM
ncbi:hypothetical protein GGG16DRAFT_104335 [Schizophyllum commune]